MEEQTIKLDKTPLPRLTVNVGITGHCRDFGDKVDTMLGQVRECLSFIKRCTCETVADEKVRDILPYLYDEEEPRFVLLSSLAYGADTLVAQEALDQHYELHVPLPLAQREYEKDFTPEGLAGFHDKLGKASRIFEVAAANPERGHAYADASRVVLNHCDVLLALWDGVDTEKIAGTAPTVELASTLHIPVIHIHTDGSTAPHLINDGNRSPEWKAELREHIESILLPAEPFSDKPEEVADFKRFVRACARQQMIPKEDRAKTYTCFTDTLQSLGKRPRIPAAPDPLGDMKAFTKGAAWRDAWEGAFGWFDGLSLAYSSIYRSGLVWRYAAPVAAVLALLVGLNCSSEGSGTWSLGKLLIGLSFIFQIIFLAVPIALEIKDRKHMWHRKFFSYRVVGERIRQIRHLWATGFSNTRRRESAYTGKKERWTAWYYRAMMRHVGLPAPISGEGGQARQAGGEEGPPRAVVDHGYLRDWLAWVRNKFVAGQIGYHRPRKAKERNMCNKLLRCGLAMFLLSLAVALARAVMFCAEQWNILPDGWIPYVDAALVFCAGGAVFFPALAVFFTGFCSYAGYAKNCQVSEDTGNNLEAICREIDGILSSPPQPAPGPGSLHYTRALYIAEQIDNCCKEELLGWEDIISTRRLKGQG